MRKEGEVLMAKQIKTIGILTSGGDAPGMNAAIRAVVRTAINKGLKVKGIQKGYNGLINEEIIDMDKRSVADIIQRGGTILYTARCMEFMTPEGQKKAQKSAKSTGLTVLSLSAAMVHSEVHKSLRKPESTPSDFREQLI